MTTILEGREKYLFEALNVIVEVAMTEEVAEKCIDILFTNESEEVIDRIYEAFIDKVTEEMIVLEENDESISEFLKDDDRPIGLAGIRKWADAQKAKRREERMGNLKDIAKGVVKKRQERAQNFAKVTRDPELRNKPQVKHELDLSQARLEQRAKRAEDIASGKLTPSYRKSDSTPEAPKTPATTDSAAGKITAINKVQKGDPEAAKKVEAAKKEFEKAKTEKEAKKKASTEAKKLEKMVSTDKKKAETSAKEVEKITTEKPEAPKAKKEKVAEKPEAPKAEKEGEASEVKTKTKKASKKTTKKSTKDTKTEEVKAPEVKKEPETTEIKEPEKSEAQKKRDEEVIAGANKLLAEIQKHKQSLLAQRTKIEKDLADAREATKTKPAMLAAVNKYERSLASINRKLETLGEPSNEAVINVIDLLRGTNISESLFMDVLSTIQEDLSRIKTLQYKLN